MLRVVGTSMTPLGAGMLRKLILCLVFASVAATSASADILLDIWKKTAKYGYCVGYENANRTGKYLFMNARSLASNANLGGTLYRIWEYSGPYTSQYAQGNNWKDGASTVVSMSDTGYGKRMSYLEVGAQPGYKCMSVLYSINGVTFGQEHTWGRLPRALDNNTMDVICRCWRQ